jgi:putative FmdB family regulatory protein
MIYDYKCRCGSTIQIERSMLDDSINPTCYDCHESMERVWTSPPVSFKGSGFYSTDHA